MSDSLKKSIALHIVILLLFVIDMPMFWGQRDTIGQVPIIVDLQNIKISEMTNLPPKAKIGAEDKKASAVQRKVEDNFTKDEPKEEPKQEEKKAKEEPKEEPEPAPVEEKPTPVKQDFLVAPQPKKPEAPKKKEEPKKPAPAPQPKKPEPMKKEAPKPNKNEPKLANPLKSLLASVDALEKAQGETDETATIKEGTVVNNMGVEGGIGGSYFSELSISEIDAIAGRLRACWNLDPGARGIEDMIVEIRAYLNKDGTVRQVDILDKSRYNGDNAFRSVADSAKRAVYICSPYKIFAEKYSDKYDTWKTMLLRFNPLDASIK